MLSTSPGTWLRLFGTLLALGIAGGESSRARGAEPPSLLFAPVEHHVHSSSIVELPGGGFLVAWYEGSGERRANDVTVRGLRLDPHGALTSSPFLLADTPDLPDCNPVLWVDGRGRLWLFWAVVVGNRWENSLLKFRRSDDPSGEGAPTWTWQDVIVLKPGETFVKTLERDLPRLGLDESMWAEYARPYTRSLREAALDPVKRQQGWMPRTHPIELRDGTYCLPLYSDGFNVSLVARSEDGGQTWKAGAPLVSAGGIQPSLVETDPGVVHAYLRDAGPRPKRAIEAVSRDGGRTWSIGRDTALPDPGSSLEVIALRDGRWLLVHNDLEQGRHRLRVQLSEDRGRTWQLGPVLAASDEHRDRFSYPSVIQSRASDVWITFSHDTSAGESIALRRLSLRNLQKTPGD